MTNREWLNSISDEKLAVLIQSIVKECIKERNEECYYCKMTFCDIGFIKKWLNEEAIND